MTRLRLILTLVLCSLGLAGVSRGQQQAWEIRPLSEDKGWVEWNLVDNLARGTNGVFIRYGNAILTADELEANTQTGEVIADGHVRIQQDEQIWASEHIRYNFKTHQLEAAHFRTGSWPLFAAGEGLRADQTNRIYVGTGTNAFVTVEDNDQPAIKVRARYIKIIPGDRVEARHATVYVGGVPIFYLPYYSRKLGDQKSNLNFIPGYRSSYGAYILGRYTWLLNEELDGVVHVDYRTRRGVGVGPDFNFHLGRWGDGTFRYYYTHDENPNIDGTGSTIPEDRQRVYFSYQATPFTNLEVKAMVRYQGDSNIVRDFFEGEYRQNPQPSTFFDVRKYWQNFSLDAEVQPRVNDFLQTVERLPDVHLTGFRQQLGNSPFYYESESSAGYYRQLFPVTNDVPLGLNYEAARADTYHQVVMPLTFFGWLNLTPRVGGRGTYYSESSGPGGTNDEHLRGVFNTGAELSFKASRLWPGIHSEALDMDGLRHIIQPSLNYVYVPTPNYVPSQLPQFDTELPSLRLLPIEFPDYNRIDSIDSQNVLRLGLLNKLQTKRRGDLINLVNWDLYTDWRIRPRSDQSTFSDLYSDMVVRPRSWITLQSLLRYDIAGGDWRMAFNTLTLHPNNVWSWSLGQFYLRDDPSTGPTSLGVGNNLFISDLFFRVNENWGLRASHRFEARTGTLQEQAYSVYRDLRSWTAGLTFRVRENPSGPQDVTVAFTFSLKAFPRFGLGTENLLPYTLFGG
jgi:LPS-assembly protein